MRNLGDWWRRIVAVGAAALVLPLAGATIATAAPLGPVHRVPAGGYQDLLVPSSMGPIKVQVQWAKRGGNAALYLLDGMRARNDYNAWSRDTNAQAQFANDNVTLVMPVGGAGSMYTDWNTPSNFNGQQITYRWETFLTQELPAYLAKFGVSPNNNGVVGLSMAGSAALALAAHHRDQFKFAASLSGAPNLSSPGAKTFLRLALLEVGGYNIDAMWGGPWDAKWARNDPFTFAPQLRGLSMFISSGTGIPVASDFNVGVGNVLNSMMLESLTNVTTKGFEIKMRQLGIRATWDYPLTGVHNWPYWQAELWKARPQILDALNAK